MEVLVLEQVSVIALVAALLARLVTVLFRRRYLWLWSVCAAMTVSIVIYVAAVVPWTVPGVALDQCGLTINVWGLGTSAAIVAFAALANGVGPRRVAAVTTAYVAISALTVVDGLAESPSPLGCLDRVHVPAWDPFWWLLVLVHVSSTVYAAYVCWALARVAGTSRGMRVDFRLLALGMTSSTVFWAGILTILITEQAWLILPLQYLICTTALSLAAGLVYGYVTAVAERVAAARRYRRLHPMHRYLAETLGEASLPAPPAWRVLASTFPPQERLYRLAVAIGDGLLEATDFAAGRRGEVPATIAEDIRRIDEAMAAEGWQPGQPIDIDVALRVARRLPLAATGRRRWSRSPAAPARVVPEGMCARSRPPQ
jgi:hypothetical protein